MTEEQKHSDGAIWSRLSDVERQTAAHTTELRGIYGGLEEIRDVLVRMQENAKPNVGGMFLILLATCTFFVTIGALSLAPVYRDLTRLYESEARIAAIQNETAGNRFTSSDAERLEETLRAETQNRHMRTVGRIHESEDQINANRDRIAQIEGYLKGKDL